MSNYIIIPSENLEENEFVDSDNNRLEEFGKISQVNLFIGANNSRKSRMLRSLIKLKEYNLSSKKINKLLTNLENSFLQIITFIEQVKEVNIKINFSKGSLDHLSRSNAFKYIVDLTNSDIKRNIKVDKDFFVSISAKLKESYQTGKSNNFLEFQRIINEHVILWNFFYNFSEVQIESNRSGHSVFNVSPWNPPVFKERDLLKEQLNLLNTLQSIKFENYSPNKIYIPTLRAAISLYNSENGSITKVEHNIFKTSITKHYNISVVY